MQTVVRNHNMRDYFGGELNKPAVRLFGKLGNIPCSRKAMVDFTPMVGALLVYILIKIGAELSIVVQSSRKTCSVFKFRVAGVFSRKLCRSFAVFPDALWFFSVLFVSYVFHCNLQ